MTDTERVIEYFKSLNLVSYPADPVGDLIESHKRQRDIIGEYADARLKMAHRWRFLPFSVRLWMGGWR